eukprot:354661-Chlamydomonas_euryale.AAC.5
MEVGNGGREVGNGERDVGNGGREVGNGGREVGNGRSGTEGGTSGTEGGRSGTEGGGPIHQALGLMDSWMERWKDRCPRGRPERGKPSGNEGEEKLASGRLHRTCRNAFVRLSPMMMSSFLNDRASTAALRLWLGHKLPVAWHAPVGFESGPYDLNRPQVTCTFVEMFLCGWLLWNATRCMQVASPVMDYRHRAVLIARSSPLKSVDGRHGSPPNPNFHIAVHTAARTTIHAASRRTYTPLHLTPLTSVAIKNDVHFFQRVEICAAVRNLCNGRGSVTD